MKIMNDIKNLVDDDKMIIVAEFPEINYALIYRQSKYEPWVAAYGLIRESKCWCQGHYFVSLEGAMEYILSLKKGDE